MCEIHLKNLRVNDVLYAQVINTDNDATTIMTKTREPIMMVDFSANVVDVRTKQQVGKFGFDNNMKWKFETTDKSIVFSSETDDLIEAERLFFIQHGVQVFNL